MATLGAALALSGIGLVSEASAKEIKRCNGQGVLCDQDFDQVVLAGAHNAMSSASLGWRIPNQSIAIPEQLEQRIRGLLIDTHYGRVRDDGVVVTDDDGDEPAATGPRGVFLCHVLCELGATRLAPGLRDIRKFLKRRPNNVLLINNEDYITPKSFASAAKRSGLRRYIYKGPTDRWPTLRQMIETREQVVVLADNRGGGIPWYHRTYAGVLQETPFSFLTPDKLTDPRRWKQSCGPNRGDVTGSLFLMNHWSPPTPPPEPDLKASAAVNDRGVIFHRAQKCAEVRGRLPSIIAADQITAGGLVAAVRDLNGQVLATGSR